LNSNILGTGLFVGSGRSLAQGGPLSVVIGFVLIGIMLYCTVHALGEMAVAFPVAGSFSAFSTRFLDPAWGFAMGWNYALQWLVTLPLETVSATIVIKYWNTSVPEAVWITVFLVIIIGINLFGVRGYGEAEFVLSIVKITAVVGFIILGIILNIGGGPGGSYIGASYWRDPGPLNNGFRGLCSVFVNAAFAFAGTELVGLAAAETANPRKTLPTAIKQVFWRICLFYVVSLTIIGFLVPYTSTHLVGSMEQDTRASPFVIAIENAGIGVLDSVMNAVILLAVLSVGNSAVYGSSRTLAALAEQRQAPRIFAYIDREGRPLIAIIAASLLGLLAYLGVTPDQEITFDWLVAISGLSSILTWGSICLAHIRFRKAWIQQGHTLDELAFRSQPGVIGSWIGFIFNCLLLATQFWVGFAPVGYEKMSVSQLVTNFFQSYMAAPIVLLFYIPYKIYYKTSIMRIEDMDLSTGMRELNLLELLADERKEQAEWPRWKRWYKVLC
jgi:yeast amino acid transporter